MASIADSISAGPRSLIVFNTLNWKRSGFVTIDLNNGDEIVDSYDRTIGSLEVLYAKAITFAMYGLSLTIFLLSDIRFSRCGHAKTRLRFQLPCPSTTLESPYYRVELDPATGAVRSIYDKQLQTRTGEPESPYRFGQYLYVTGGDKAPNSIAAISRTCRRNRNCRSMPAHDGRLVSVKRTPFGWVARHGKHGHEHAEDRYRDPAL